ncbi:MAG: discoidin domain-containing protein [Verrucomicrobia bacterium]|nr:discoidin domain-containing protein [Verrucomicrobiota bacterium]
MKHRIVGAAAALALTVASARGAENAAIAEAAPRPPSPPYLTPAESARLVQLPPGYRLELVLSEPEIREPVVSVFDGNGRLYVAEMRTYMQDADATDEKAPTSRVSLHWSSKGDGVFDRHSVFADGLLLPRMILPLRNSVLIQETDTGDVFEYRDTNHDGVADEKKLFHAFERRFANLEHQSSGLVWALDNWIYTTVNAERIRWTPQGAIKEPTAPNGGQWGLAQDDSGKLWFTNAGSEVAPLNFQQPIVYGAIKHRDEFAPGFKEVFPLIGLADVQGGRPRFRPEEKTLNHITGAAGIEIYRGDRLPAELLGDLFFGEPVGRLVRRAKVETNDGVTIVRNAHEKSEFLRSADPYFRPVNVTTAPDGTMFITDMYRGIIQEGNWTRRGSYLRGVIDQYGMGGKINRGRVWRLVHTGTKLGPQPRMLEETPAQLVAHLSHPNGWWRDTAQKLLVLAQDKSVVPALRSLAQTSANTLARVHAIWALEGLDNFDAAFARQLFRDTDARVRVAAIRASETVVKRGDATLAADILALCKDPQVETALQAMMSANLLKLPEAKTIISRAAQGSPIATVKEVAVQLLNPIGGTIGAQFTGAQRQLLERGQAVYLELCFACHGLDGKGTPMEGRTATLAPPLAGSATVTGHRDAVIMALLHGVSGPIAGQTYDSQMLPMGANDDAWIAAVASYVRTSFGHQSPLIAADDVARVRAAHAERKDAWTLKDLNAQLPQPIGNRTAWKLTTNRVGAAASTAGASGGVAAGPATFSFTAKAPVSGAWLQIELPEATTISELRLNSTSAPRNYTRAYKIELSTDGENWGEPVATGRGGGPIVDIAFGPAKARWVRITHTAPFGFGPGGGAGRAGRGADASANNASAAASASPRVDAAPRGGEARPASAGGFGPPQNDWTLDDVQLLQPAPHAAAAGSQ